MRKRDKSILIRAGIGLVLLVVGLYWFTSSVTVETGFYSWRIGSFRAGGLVVVPLIAGVIWLFADSSSKWGKILTGLGILIILASVIMGTTFVFRKRSLYEYIIMLVCIFGGTGLILSVFIHRQKDEEEEVSQIVSPQEYDKLQNEIEELKKKYEDKKDKTE